MNTAQRFKYLLCYVLPAFVILLGGFGIPALGKLLTFSSPRANNDDFLLFLSWSVGVASLTSIVMQFLFSWSVSPARAPGVSRFFTPRKIVSLWLPGYSAAIGFFYIIRAFVAFFSRPAWGVYYLSVGLLLFLASLITSIAIQAVFSTFGTIEYFPRRLEKIGARKLLSLWLPLAVIAGGILSLALLLVMKVVNGSHLDRVELLVLGFFLIGPGVFFLVLMQSLFTAFSPSTNLAARVLGIIGLVLCVLVLLLAWWLHVSLRNFSMV
jgi:hypothetical protein